MEKWIILIIQFTNDENVLPIDELVELAVCDEESGELMLFDSLDEADQYREKHSIDGQCVELPIYDESGF